MTTTATMDEETLSTARPGAQLAAIRLANGYTIEDIARKLHLRVHVIQLLEIDDYQKLPEAVFVKGYLRAYAKLLEVDSDSLLESFNQNYVEEQSSEKSPLWQSKRDTSRGEKVIRWLTTLFGLIVLTSVVIWWQKSQENQSLFAHTTAEVNHTQTQAQAQKTDTKDAIQAENIRLTDLSTMRSLLSSEAGYSALETKSE
jgi:cytoskeleton protein RodZ